MFKKKHKCRICDCNEFTEVFKIDKMPVTAEPINSETDIEESELNVLQCKKCSYVFLNEVIDASFYESYLYTPQISNDIKEYLNSFVNKIKAELKAEKNSKGIEIGSGDGSLCKEFNNNGIKFTGVEPSQPLSKISLGQGVETVNSFWNKTTAEQISKNSKADLIVIRHVLEHIDNFDELFEGINLSLSEKGYLIIEVPYLGSIINDKQFYAFFFEHLSYFSLKSLKNLLNKYGFNIVDYTFVYPEGGSVLIYAGRKEIYNAKQKIDDEINYEVLNNFKKYFDEFKNKFFKELKNGKKFGGYGAGQRGVTLLNLLNVTNLQIEAVFDENSNYYGLFTPKSKIPVLSPEKLNKDWTLFIFATSYEKQIREKYKDKAGKFISINEIL